MGGEDVGGVLSRVLREDFRDHLKGLPERPDRILVQAGTPVPEPLDPHGRGHLRRPGARHQPPIDAARRPHGIRAVVDRPLQVVEHALRARAQQHGGDAGASPRRLGRGHVEDGAVASADLLDADGAAGAGLLRGGGPETHEGARSRGPAEAAELPFGGNFDAHHAVPFDEVQGHFGDRAAGDDHVRAGVGDGLDDVVHLLFLRAVVAQQIVGVLHEDGPLGLRPGGLDATPEDHHLHLRVARVLPLALDGRLRIPQKDHAAHHAALGGTPPHNLAHPHVVHAEGRRPPVLRGLHGPHARVHDQRRENLLHPVLLPRQHRPHDPQQRRPVPGVRQRPAHARGQRLVQQMRRRGAVPPHDLVGVQTHPDQALGRAQQLPREGQGEVRAVPVLPLLALRCEAEHAHSRVQSPVRPVSFPDLRILCRRIKNGT
mmetsp:Transcript_47289/g.92243  ORF Transcript_47289/g.92243 Transcript_47289/m.92243 type:complete len:430 (+) Transcript_47289:731-2020(+)